MQKSILNAPNLSLLGFWILVFEFELSSPQVLAWFNKQRNPLSCFHRLCIRDKEVFFPTKVSWQNGKTQGFTTEICIFWMYLSAASQSPQIGCPSPRHPQCITSDNQNYQRQNVFFFKSMRDGA